MAYDSHVRRGHPIIFSLLLIFAIIELSISAWLVARFNQHHNFLDTAVRDRTRYLLFCSVWTVLLSPFFLAMTFVAPGSIFASLASHTIFLFVTWVFWLAGAAAIAEALGGRLNCSHHFVYCGQLNTLEAFAWMIWVLLTLAFFFVLFMSASALRRGDGARGPLISA